MQAAPLAPTLHGSRSTHGHGDHMKPLSTFIAATVVSLAGTAPALAQDNKLRLITWADYAPKEVVEQFTKETGIAVEITLSNNEEMISKLRATGGAGFDLAQPS